MVSLGICLSLATALQGGPVFVPVTEFTLAWTHSIEKVRWEEDYVVRLDAVRGQPVLQAVQARVRGSAAGMEPPPDALLRQGWYHYTPAITTPPELRLTRSEFTPDYEVCVQGRCRPMADWMASDGGVTLLKACLQPAS
ncbi:MAG: DUF1850 domain-containing protein [Rhodoferax sp.]|uniref:DUF1850 domain-containing protein n=1 Tax=Rhodoferax sp. TaxID=50421 RepID=UPI0008B71504|nr:DUF1850 domain-containing protein [Rhodoferax sp.]MDP2680522.1 DUF1850 domain-containing protein [Rhodoferax sp.]OGB51103.1 MAG: hypothetical protein A2503_14140 [Burkholderiales bacterium RIFOXYD12_FULL_59_19]OGB80054.1 MAG: hypothetical protein A2496_02825 [Burkholderiales bacterium RIFOXYC12_FULL_60_6]